MAARTSATERVFVTLRQSILSGEMEPGSQHSIYRLADELGVSRTPVREAVLRLADAGLVSVERNRGVRVRGVSVEDVLDVFELRLLLEVPAAGYAARAADDAQRDRLRDGLAAMTRAARDDDAAAFDEADRAVHRAIHEAAANERLADVVRSHRSSIQARGASTVHRSRGPEQILAEHVPLVEAICAGDAVAARRHMRTHLLHTAELLAAQLGQDDLGPWRARVDALTQ